MATLLSQNHQVTAVDVIPEKVEKIKDVIDLVLKVNSDAVMVIKSIITVSYTRSLYVKLQTAMMPALMM